MIKKILLLMGLFVFAFPVGSAFAEVVSSPEPYHFSNGLFDDPNIIKKHNFINSQIDNKLNTRDSILGSGQYVEFSYPVNIKGFHMIYDTLGANVIFSFSNGKNYEYWINKYDTEILVNNLNLLNVVRIDVKHESSGGRGGYLKEIDFFGSYDPNYIHPGEPGDITPPEEVSNVNVETTEDSATITFDNPDDVDFSHANVYINGQVYETTNGQVIIDGLIPETTYTATIKTVDTLDNESEGVEVTFTTKEKSYEEDKEIQNLTANTTHKRVDLSWKLPKKADTFEHVTIYRKVIENETSSIFNLFVTKTFASDPYDPIFETNGTYFNDLTVDAATTYEYKLTTTHEGQETPGVTIQATTAPPIVEGGRYEQTPEGDYIFKWSEPTKGQVKIYIDGKEYATTDASNKSYTILAKDMKYNAFGDPLVTLQAIAPNGTAGDVTNWSGETLSGIVLPFTAKDVVSVGNSLLFIVAPLFLLALSLILAPRLIELIRKSFRQRNNQNLNYVRRTGR